MRHRVSFEFPLTCQVIRRKQAAWVELYGRSPRILLDGTFRALGGDLCFLHGNTVVQILRKYLLVRVDGNLERVDIRQDLGSTGRLVFEESR
jgi:hypothetical protein